MPIQAPQWTDFRLCPVCQNEFNEKLKPPISLGCGHSICQSCLFRLSKQQCPFDQAEIKTDIKHLPINYALLSLVGGKTPQFFEVNIPEVRDNRKAFDNGRKCIEILAESLQNVYITGNSTSNNHNTANGSLTRPMQRKLVTLIHSQLAEEEGRARAMRSARSIGERAVKELILMHQSPQTLSAALWAAVRQRGCQFLGPAMQEAVLQLILLSLEDGISLSRKVLVLFVVQKLETQYTQASKTSIGHVVQLLYRASCFKVTKRDGDSSLLQLHEKYRTYSALRKEHDAQIVQIAMEAGLHISPEQWSALLYGDDDHKSHMQSIIDKVNVRWEAAIHSFSAENCSVNFLKFPKRNAVDSDIAKFAGCRVLSDFSYNIEKGLYHEYFLKLQTPASFASSIQELIIALQRTGDPHDLQNLRSHLDKLSLIDPSPESPAPSWMELEECMTSLLTVVEGLQAFAKDYASKNKGNIEGAQMINTKYRTSMCRDILQRNTCPRGANCNFAHSEEEVERYRKRRNLSGNKASSVTTPIGMYPSSRAGSNSSPDSCADLDDEHIEQQKNSPNLARHLSISIPSVPMSQFRPPVTSATYSGNQDINGMTESLKNMHMEPFSPTYIQPQMKKEEVMPGREMIKVPPSYETPIPQPLLNSRPNPPLFNQLLYSQSQQIPSATFYETSTTQQQQHQAMYLANNQHQYIAPNAQQIYQQPMQHIYQYQPDLPPYTALNAHQAFAPNFTAMRTAVARGCATNDHSDLLKQSTSTELSLNIPPLKDPKEDNWRFTNNKSFGRGIDSCIDSGRGSSLGSDTFSPSSNTSGGSRGSPQSLQENEATRNFWDEKKIWGAPSSSSSWSNSKTSNWDFFKDTSRHSDPEERNTSSESVGKGCDHKITSLSDDLCYSSLLRKTDIMNNNHQGLLSMYNPGKPPAPPPGFNLIKQ